MGETSKFDPLATGAYLLFRTELARHIEAIEAEVGSGGGDLSVEAGTRLGTAFHTIKGGAGFFGLHALAAAANRLEHLFLEARTYSGEEVTALVRELSDLSRRLPAPTGGDNRCPTS